MKAGDDGAEKLAPGPHTLNQELPPKIASSCSAAISSPPGKSPFVDGHSHGAEACSKPRYYILSPENTLDAMSPPDGWLAQMSMIRTSFTAMPPGQEDLVRSRNDGPCRAVCRMARHEALYPRTSLTHAANAGRFSG